MGYVGNLKKMEEITVCRAVQEMTDLWKSSVRRVQSRQSIPLAC